MKIWMTGGPRQQHLTCPVCRQLVDGLTAITEERSGPAIPTPGCMTVCCYCASLLAFIQSFASYRHVSLRAATKQEEDEARNDPLRRILWETVRELQDKIRRRRG